MSFRVKEKYYSPIKHIVGCGNETSTLQNHSYVRSTSETTLIVALSEALPYPVPSTNYDRTQ